MNQNSYGEVNRNKQNYILDHADMLDPSASTFLIQPPKERSAALREVKKEQEQREDLTKSYMASPATKKTELEEDLVRKLEGTQIAQSEYPRGAASSTPGTSKNKAEMRLTT